MRSNTTSRLLLSWFPLSKGNPSSSMCNQWSIHWEPFLPRKVTKVTNKYLSRTMVGAEHRYNPIEKEFLALVFAVQKTRHYLTGQSIYVVSKINPLRLLMTKPSALNGRLTKWAMLLSQYDIHFLPQKATKGQAIADLLAENPTSKSATLFEELPDETAEVHSSQVHPMV